MWGLYAMVTSHIFQSNKHLLTFQLVDHVGAQNVFDAIFHPCPFVCHALVAVPVEEAHPTGGGKGQGGPLPVVVLPKDCFTTFHLEGVRWVLQRHVRMV